VPVVFFAEVWVELIVFITLLIDLSIRCPVLELVVVFVVASVEMQVWVLVI
jgi:hypothetical protein